jgi:hypothetical protein
MNGQAEESNALTFDGVDDYIDMDLDGVAGPELVTNGTFDTDTAWTKGTGWTISGGTANADGTGNGTNLTQAGLSLVAGRRYLMTYTLIRNSGAIVPLLSGGGGSVSFNSRTVSGTYTQVVTATHNHTSLIFQSGVSPSQLNGSVDNVTLKELPTTAVEKLSPNLVTNGGFDVDANWVKGTGWTIGGGVAVGTSVGAFVKLSQQPFQFIAGGRYKVTFTVVSRSAGGVLIDFTGGSQVNGTVRTAAGTYTEYMVARDGNNNLNVESGADGFSGTVDNVIVEYVAQVDSQGTSTLTYRSQGDGITGTAGTAFDIKLGDAEEIPCSEGADDKVHGVIQNKAYRVVNSQPAMWFNKQNIFHYNMVHGHSLGVFDPVAEINELLFSTGNQGTFIAPTWSETMIGGNSFGTGVQNILDLSPRNNPFSQATPSSRGAWFREPKTGRRNLFERTEQFGDAYWVKVNTTVTQNTEIAPDGSLSADTVLGSAGLTNLIRATDLTAIASTYTFSVYCKAGTATTFDVILRDVTALVNLNATAAILSGPGTVNVVGGFTVGISGLSTTAWTRVAITLSSAMTGGNLLRTQIYPESASSGLTTGKSIILWGAQLELGSTPTAYQRVTTAFDVTEAGQRDCFGVRADGIDDFYQRAINFSGTDKVTVFAAVRKFVDSGAGWITELSTNVASVDGTFAVVASSSLGDASRRTYSGFTRGTVSTRQVSSGLVAAPSTNIFTSEFDNGAVTADQVKNRLNGVPNTLGTDSTTSPGNFINATLNLFARNGTTLFFNGNLYALIVAGGSYPLSTIQRVERILSRITPTVNL